jgi:hypothetical protein
MYTVINDSKWCRVAGERYQIAQLLHQMIAKNPNRPSYTFGVLSHKHESRWWLDAAI